MSKANTNSSYQKNPDLFPCGEPTAKNITSSLKNKIIDDETIKDICQMVLDKIEEENSIPNAFSLEGVDNSGNSKFNLDDSGVTGAYGDIGNNNWSAQDLATALNNTSANAVPPTVPSGINYSTTVWDFGVTNSGVEYVYVVSGNVPSTLDLVSIPVSIPVSSL